MKLPENNMRALLNSAPDATVIVDEDGHIVFANMQVSVVFGYEPDALIGSAVEVLLPDRFRATHGAYRSAFVRSPQVRPMGSDLELFGRHQDGSEFPIEISLSPLRTDAGLLVSSAIRDVSERKALERTLNNAKEAAERATATKSRFLAAASHDLRQPLQSIAIYLSVSVMGELLDALLDISKLDAGSITPSKRDFRLQSVFDALVADNAPAASETR